jgi:adsorption protein B
VIAAPDSLLDVAGSLATYHALLQGALTALALLYLLSGVDDLFIDAVYWLRALRRATWRRHRIRQLAPDALAARPEQLIAIMIPAWDEAAVLESMLARLTQTVDYQRYRVYVGVYPNDAATRLAVGRAAAADSRIRTVVLDHDGPTVKADCLNGIWRAIARDEAAQGEPFGIYVMQDCEDVIDPLAWRLFNWLIPRKDMVQLPVLSLPRRWWQFTGAHYLDEFAQQHLKDLVVREVLGRGLPAAGVGVAFSRRALQALAQTDPDGVPFRTDSLTEDYDLGLRLRGLGYQQIFARFWVTRTHVALDPQTGAVRPERRRELVCVREYFPSTLRAAVRQKARWVVGIALQGWRTWGWRGDWTGRYLLMRDRKVLLMSLAGIAAYLVFFLIAAHWAWNWLETGRLDGPALRDPGSWLPALLIANLVLLGLRALQRALCTGLLYGPLEALLSLPRMVWASVINILATLRALRLWLGHLATGQPIGWDKTVHQFPDAAPLAAVKSMADLSHGAAGGASGSSLDVGVEHPPWSAGGSARSRPSVPFSTNDGART